LGGLLKAEVCVISVSLNEHCWFYNYKHFFFRYERFVIGLEEASRDMLPALKNKALKVS